MLIPRCDAPLASRHASNGPDPSTAETGTVVEVENRGPAHAPILEVQAGRLGIDAGRRLWIALFDTEDGVLAVMVGGSTADWDHALTVAEPVLESVVIDA